MYLSYKSYCSLLVPTSKRIVLLGKTGGGKSSLANTIFEKELFKVDHTFNSGTKNCQTETKSVNGRSITLIDTPGLFDTDTPEEQMKLEIVRCITECTPGPHAFLIVLKVEIFTEQEQAVIKKICQNFSEKALKYAVVAFTHGDQLREGMKIEEFVSHNKNLSDLVQKCGGRCHVFDNKYWNNNKDDSYRNNQQQVAELLNTLDKMSEANQESYYTNEMLQAVNAEIQREIELIRQSQGKISQKEMTEKAKMKVSDEIWIRSASIATAVLLGALLGVVKGSINAKGLLGHSRCLETFLSWYK